MVINLLQVSKICFNETQVNVNQINELTNVGNRARLYMYQEKLTTCFVVDFLVMYTSDKPLVLVIIKLFIYVTCDLFSLAN